MQIISNLIPSEIMELYERIYITETKNLAKEVLTCYQAGAYRATIINLWITVICDICYKIKELNDVYEEEKAHKLLEWLKTTKEECTNATKQGKFIINSAWEYNLIIELKQRFGSSFISDNLYTHLESLKMYRNSSAHPLLEEDYTLKQPNKKIVLGLIEAIFAELLCIPTLRHEEFTGELVSALAKNSEILKSDEDKLKNFISNYLDKTDETTKVKIFKTLWKFVFKSDDENCKTNKKINTLALIQIIKSNEEKYFKEIKGGIDYYNYNFDKDDRTNESFFKILSSIKDLIKLFPEITIGLVRLRIENNLNYLMMFGYNIFDSEQDLTIKVLNKYKTVFENGNLINSCGYAIFKNRFEDQNYQHIKRILAFLAKFLTSTIITKEVYLFFNELINQYINSRCLDESNCRNLILRELYLFFNVNNLEHLYNSYNKTYNSQITYFDELSNQVRGTFPHETRLILKQLIKNALSTNLGNGIEQLMDLLFEEDIIELIQEIEIPLENQNHNQQSFLKRLKYYDNPEISDFLNKYSQED